MRIKEIGITNFRALCAEQIAFNDYTCLVGSNGAGKSTLITALKIFKQFGQRMGMEQFAAYFKANQEGASAPDLKKIYEGIRDSFTELPSTTAKGTMKDALRSFEAFANG